MRQPDHEYEERSFGDIQRAIDFENSMNAEPAPNGIYPDFHPKQQGYLCQSVW